MNQPNNLRRIALDYNTFPEVMFLAEAEREGFADVEILTTSCYNRDRAIELAFDSGATLDNIEECIIQILPSISSSSEFVEVLEDKVLVVLNVSEINDHAVNKALLMLMRMSEFTPGIRTTFNEHAFPETQFSSRCDTNTQTYPTTWTS